MQRANTLETQHIQGGIDIFPFFFIFPFISVLIFVEKSMTILLPNKSVSGHIFQKKNEHVSMLFWQSRVPTCLFGSNMLVVFFAVLRSNTLIWPTLSFGSQEY